MEQIDLEKDSLTPKGRQNIVETLVQSSSDPDGKRNTEVCWQYYNNKQDPEKYNYLRKSGEYEYPAKVRRIPKQSVYVNNLVSQQSQRPFAFSCYAIDDESIARKYDDIVKRKLAYVEDKALKSFFAIQAQMQALDAQKQQIMEMLNQEPQNQEQMAMFEKIRAALPGIEQQMAYSKKVLSEQLGIMEEEVRKLDQFYKYEYKDATEIIGQKLTRVLRQDLQIAYKEMLGMKHRCVSGLEYYYVDYLPGEKYPRFDIINEMKVYVPASDTPGWTQYAPWVRIEEGLTYEQVLAEFGMYLSNNDIELLKSSPSYNQGAVEGAFVATRHGAVLKNDMKGVYSGSMGSAGGYVVNRVWWRAPRIIRAKRSPNKYFPGQEATHFIYPDKVIIHEADFKYNASQRKWVSRTNPDIEYKDKEVETINREKGEYIKEKIVYDRYKGFTINNAIVYGFRDPIQPRPFTDLGQVLLPIVGRMYNSTTDTPYSLIWNTIELQDTYDIIHYHRELLLALSGVAGVVMDISQKPEGMSEEEWYYNMKLGRILIETVTKGGRKNFAFNQFPRVDMSLSASVQYIDNMLRSVDESIGMVMGITRQRMGQNVNSDQVGTFEMSRNLSLLTTELIFREHDETVRQALSMCLNLATRYCWDKGAMLQLMDDGIEYLGISSGQLKDIEFALRIENNTQESFNLEELRKVGLNMSMKGQLPFRDFVSIYKVNSVRELEKKLEYLAKEAEEMMDLRMSKQANVQAQIDQKKQEFQAQLEQIKQQSENELKGMSEKLKDARERAKLEIDAETLEFEKEKWQDEKGLEIARMRSESQVENRIISENQRASMSADQINLLSTQLSTMLEMLRMKMDDKNEGKKIEVEKAKATKLSKEHATGD